MCKYNIAAYDRRILPHRNRPEKVQFLDIYRLFPDSVRIKRETSMARPLRDDSFLLDSGWMYEA